MLRRRSTGGSAERTGEHGQILILFALTLVVILAFASIVIDVGFLRNNRQILVNAMDAAALAGGTVLPVDGSVSGEAAAATALVTQTINANYPSLPSSNYTITYRCLIGADPSTGAPLITRDIPAVCSPNHALGHAPIASDFQGAGPTRFTACRPDLGDRCNVVVVEGNATTPFSFGRVVGVNQGSTGVVTSAACNGPCGQPPFSPVDVVLVIDRTGSMAGDEQNLRDAAAAVLDVYNPAVQRVALGMLGPSSGINTCGTPASHGVPLTLQTVQPPTWDSVQSGQNANAGATTLVLTRPTGVGAGDLLVAGITVDTTTTLATVTPPSGWTLINRANSGTQLSVLSYRKVATGSEAASYTWTIGASTRAAGGIMSIGGADTSNPIVASAVSTATAASTSVVAPSLTAINDSLLVGFFGSEANTTMSQPSSTTERFEAKNGNAAGPTISGITDTVNAGSTGNITSTSGTSARWAAMQIAIRPAPVAESYGTDLVADMDNWIPVGMTGTAGSPAPVLNEDYLSNSSHIRQAINCFSLSGTGTNLSTPMRMATEYLKQHGRPGVKWGIIFETDGAPNYNGSSGDPSNYTCAAAQAAADAAKANVPPIEIFTIGFGVGTENCPDGGGSTATLLSNMATGPKLGASSCNAAENTDGDHFFCQPAGNQLSSVFAAAAQELADIRTHLVQLYPPPIVTSISPSSGPPAGNTLVTVSGKYFTSATSVAFGGGPGTIVSISDSSITVRAPAGASGTTVDVVVTTPGGSSPTVSADRYRYN